jgi:hypothetical protein
MFRGATQGVGRDGGHTSPGQPLCDLDPQGASSPSSFPPMSSPGPADQGCQRPSRYPTDVHRCFPPGAKLCSLHADGARRSVDTQSVFPAALANTWMDLMSMQGCNRVRDTAAVWQDRAWTQGRPCGPEAGVVSVPAKQPGPHDSSCPPPCLSVSICKMGMVAQQRT